MPLVEILAKLSLPSQLQTKQTHESIGLTSQSKYLTNGKIIAINATQNTKENANVKSGITIIFVTMLITEILLKKSIVAPSMPSCADILIERLSTKNFGKRSLHKPLANILLNPAMPITQPKLINAEGSNISNGFMASNINPAKEMDDIVSYSR